MSPDRLPDPSTVSRNPAGPRFVHRPTGDLVPLLTTPDFATADAHSSAAVRPAVFVDDGAPPLMLCALVDRRAEVLSCVCELAAETVISGVLSPLVAELRELIVALADRIFECERGIASDGAPRGLFTSDERAYLHKSVPIEIEPAVCISGKADPRVLAAMIECRIGVVAGVLALVPEDLVAVATAVVIHEAEVYAAVLNRAVARLPIVTGARDEH